MDEQIEHQENDVQAENSASQIKQTSPIGLDRNRKIAVAVLGLVAFVLIISWSKNLQFQLNDPFTYKGGDDEEVVVDDDSDAALRLKDTDNDGLNDYDELNVYMTSPYLDDTDSDGFKDGEEIANGNNPNCAAGAECESAEQSVDLSTVGMSVVQEKDLLEMLGKTEANLLLTMSDVSEIRNIFVELGYDKNKLDAFSDEDVYRMYLAAQEAYSKNKKNTESNNSSDSFSVEEIQSIRAAYEKAGYKKDDLDKISDEDLMSAYRSALLEYENNN